MHIYTESHSPQPPNISNAVASNISGPRGQKVSFRTNKVASLATLLTEEAAYVVRHLTLLGRERPADVFDTVRTLLVQLFDLTIHQRLTRAFANVDVNVKPLQWMARSRHASGDLTQDDVERWALLRLLPSSLRTTLEMP